MQAPELSNALAIAATFGPGFGAFMVMLLFGGRTGLRRWLSRCIDWRAGLGCYAFAALAPPAIMVVALGVHVAFGRQISAWPIADHVLVAVAKFPLVAMLGGPLGEEFGWRGYALPALTARMGWRRASLILGCAWAAWHAPLFLMDGTAQGNLPIALFLVTTMGLSVLFARISVNAAFSVLPAILLHATINWWSMALPITPMGADVGSYPLVAGLTTLVALVAYFMRGPKPSKYHKRSQ